MRKKWWGGVLLGLSVLLAGAPTATAAKTNEPVTPTSVRELYSGVRFSSYALPEDSGYGLQKFWTVEFDSGQSDLYFDVVGGGTYANNLKTVSGTVADFSTAHPDRTVLAAVNGDLWMVGYAHSRVEGSGTTYGGYSDPVVTRALTVPRSFNVYGGEIITSTYIKQETPYEGDFYAFGMTADGVPVLGNPQVAVNVTSGSTSLRADGINRLPVSNAIILYTDRGPASNYALSDAYEVAIDCGDYTVRHGETITGTVAEISAPGEGGVAMRAGRLILTARGSRAGELTGLTIGSTVSVGISVSDRMGNDAIWQNIENAVGGHYPVILNGQSTSVADTTYYPTSLLGITKTGNTVMLVNDGRQKGYSQGFSIAQLDELCTELGIETAFLLDGGGSAEMVIADGSGSVQVVNRPSDGSERTVVNTVILSAGPKRERSGGAAIRFDDTASAATVTDSFNVDTGIADDALCITLTGTRNPRLTFTCPSGTDLRKYRYVTVTARAQTSLTDHNQMRMSFSPADSASSSDPYLLFRFDETRTGWQTGSFELSGAWNGEVRSITARLFDYTGIGEVGDSVQLREIAFFQTQAEADAYRDRLMTEQTEGTTAEPGTTESTGTKGTDPAANTGCTSAVDGLLPAAAIGIGLSIIHAHGQRRKKKRRIT